MDDDNVRDLLGKRRYSQALERLLDLYGTKVYRMALMFLKDVGRAEEVAQDVFLTLWKVLPAYDGRASPGTWLYTIARNKCLSAVRAETYRATSSLDASNEPAIPTTILRDMELAQCLDQLPEVQREVITLFYLQEKSVKDVALMLNLPKGTVKSHLHRARTALAAMLREQNDGVH
jgi:RNA polymerase sigma-70 factor (ECF subfamily)